MHPRNNGDTYNLHSHEWLLRILEVGEEGRAGEREREREREGERERVSEQMSLLPSPRTSFSPVTIFNTKTSTPYYASYLYWKFAWETQTNDNLLHSRTNNK